MLGIGGGPCRVDKRFARLASVGLIVLAPRPVACDVDVGIPGIIDIRFADEDGVDVPLPLGRPGDLDAKDEDLLWSGVKFAVDTGGGCLGGGWRDFAFAARAVARRAPSVAMFPDPAILDRNPPASDRLFAEVLDARLGRRLCDGLDDKSVSVTPCPIDFRAPFPVVVPEMGGY